MDAEISETIKARKLGFDTQIIEVLEQRKYIRPQTTQNCGPPTIFMLVNKF